MNNSNKFRFLCRDTTVITSSKEYNTSFDGKTIKLVIQSAKLEHTGNYKVVVSNEGGKDESSAQLTVEVSYLRKFKFESVSKSDEIFEEILCSIVNVKRRQAPNTRN